MARKKSVKRANNEGTVVQLKSGRWRAQVSLGYTNEGTRNRPSEVFDTYTEANNWRIQKLAIAQQYGNESAKEITGMFVPAYHKWLLEQKKDSVQPVQFKVMMRNYANHIKPFFLKLKQKDIGNADFQKFFKLMETKKVGAETRKKMFQNLRQYFEFVYQGTPMRNPLDGIEYESKKRAEIVVPDNPLFQEDYKAVPKELREKFFKALDDEKDSRFIKPLCYIMYFTGNRIGEVLALQWKDFDFSRRFYYIYKSVTKHYDFDENGETVGKSRSVVKSPKSLKGIRPLPMIDIIFEVMSEWRELCTAKEKVTGISFTAPNDFVFANKKGLMRSEDGTETIFSRFLKRHGLDHQGIHFHALRQTFSNALFATDSDETMITDLMGHADISTTKKHYKSLEKFDSVQKAAKKMNELFKPKNPIYRANDTVTYAPDGYISELQAMNTEPEEPTQDEPPKRSLNELLAELSSYPEFKELLKNAQKKELVIE